ncbi:hypothetical protein [Nostoc sp.]
MKEQLTTKNNENKKPTKKSYPELSNHQLEVVAGGIAPKNCQWQGTRCK